MLVIFSSPPFYSDHVILPKVGDPVPDYILNNSRFFPFFRDALGAIDGSHFNAHATASDRDALRDRNGALTTNALAICDFKMRFLHIQSGWEGSVADAQMFHDARFTDLRIPDGKYFLADAGFPTCSSLLVPYRGPRYHLAEWGRAQLRYECYFYVILLLINQILQSRHTRRTIQFETCHGSKCHREGIRSD